jgi:hypothetical protein
MCVDQSVFYEHLDILSYGAFKKWVQRNKLRRLRTAGNGRCGLIDWQSVPAEFKAIIRKAFGDPYNQDDLQTFLNQLQPDPEAALFYERYKLADRSALPNNKIAQYYAEAIVLNLYDQLCTKLNKKKMLGTGIKITAAKEKIVAIIKDLKTVKNQNGAPKYPHNLPTNYRAMDRKLNKFKADGYASLIHSNIGTASNNIKITGEVADWLLGYYSLPNKPVVPVLHNEYMKVRESRNWPTLSESAVAKWLEKPAQRKKWFLARHGAEEYRRIYGHKITRDRSDMFPNCHWAIDGTKLDWIHLKDNAQGMGADLKIDVVFDVYSEKILGYYIGTDHESYKHHFKALKMAANEAQSRPYLINYDGQGGHITGTMQHLYSNLVARNGGTHYKHRAQQHGSPAEQLFKRFQQQVLNTKWFSDGQGIASSKTLDSKMNTDFIMANKHRLMNIDQLIEAFKLEVQKWNTMRHPHYKETRNAIYNREAIVNEPLNMFETVELFWVSTKDTRRYERDGIKPVIDKVQYHFEVYDENGMPDLDFRDKYTESKFYIKYDPDQLDNFVRLEMEMPDGDRKFIADAQPVKKLKQVPVLMTPEDHQLAQRMRKVRDIEEQRIRKDIAAREVRTGITPDKLIDDQELEIKFGGTLPKQQRSVAEADSFLLRM